MAVQFFLEKKVWRWTPTSRRVGLRGPVKCGAKKSAHLNESADFIFFCQKGTHTKRNKSFDLKNWHARHFFSGENKKNCNFTWLKYFLGHWWFSLFCTGQFFFSFFSFGASILFLRLREIRMRPWHPHNSFAFVRTFLKVFSLPRTQMTFFL